MRETACTMQAHVQTYGQVRMLVQKPRGISVSWLCDSKVRVLCSCATALTVLIHLFVAVAKTPPFFSLHSSTRREDTSLTLSLFSVWKTPVNFPPLHRPWPRKTVDLTCPHSRSPWSSARGCTKLLGQVPHTPHCHNQ